MGTMKFDARHVVRIVVAAGLAGALSLSSALAAPAADDVEAQAHEAWQETIARSEVPAEGCFHASYPSTEWLKVDCTAAPNIPYLPRKGAASLTVGDGADYVAEVSGLMTQSVGTFPLVSGVTSETGLLGANDYSLQLNSNFMTTAVCKGIPSCLSWEQFVYSSGYTSAFMQYWLISYDKKCPSGWMAFETDCYKNSAAVTVPEQAITELAKLKLSGKAVAGGKDTLTFTTETEAYSTTGKDSVVDLATDWQESEFNIFGDGDGSAATFNKGSTIKVKIAVTDGSTSAPTCAANAGTTGETNNLSLKSCSASGGKMPSIVFKESN
jgi:hypothetical protein